LGATFGSFPETRFLGATGFTRKTGLLDDACVTAGFATIFASDLVGTDSE
jgi:hypothetical protein